MNKKIQNTYSYCRIDKPVHSRAKKEKDIVEDYRTYSLYLYVEKIDDDEKVVRYVRMYLVK